jgi:hypothetical protein
MFHMAALPKAERRELSHTLAELVLRVRLLLMFLGDNVNLLDFSVHLTAKTAIWSGMLL